MKLSESKALITGGASGLGLACARTIIAAGGEVTLLDINPESGAAAIAELGNRARFQVADVSDEAAVADAVDAAVKAHGQLNVVINCAGILSPGRVLGREAPMPLEHFSRAVNINLIGSFNVAKAAAWAMQNNPADEDGQRGVIIHTASIAAFEGQIGQSAYAASKAGIVGMTLPMARELARFGIRVMTIAPGVFLTPMVAGLPDEVQQALGASVPFPSRLGKPAEFADTAAHIIENTYLNGSVIRLDGATRLAPK